MTELKPFGDKGMLEPIRLRHGKLRPVILDGELVDMTASHRCPECGNWVGDGEAECPPGAMLLPLKPKRRKAKFVASRQAQEP